MDCIIPHHSVRLFCSSIIACSKIGKDLYLDFDPIDGLTLRTLNEAKSAYVCFHYQSSFFERCTAPPLDLLEKSRSRKRDRRQQQLSEEDASDSDNNDNDNDNNDNGHFTCRMSIKALAAAVRQRKNVQSLRLSLEQESSALRLAFEFLLSPGGNPEDAWASSLRVVHRVPLADYPVVIVSAVAATAGASELVAAPKLFLRLLDPLQRHSETALVIHAPSQNSPQLLATAFQQTEHAGNASALSGSHLQTETRLSYDDLEEMDFVDDRPTDDDADAPEDVNNLVVLVFSRREAKAVLQWSSSATENEPLHVLFHWGGRPLLLEQRTATWKVELVLATLDHTILGSMALPSSMANTAAANGE
jgi:hypothetical protein